MVPDQVVATLDELGLDKRRVSEWRDVRDAGEKVVDGAIANALAEGRAPTKNEILAAAKAIKAERQVEKAELVGGCGILVGEPR